jgi:hypothetical protein
LKIDLRWHLGNAFYLLVIARRTARKREMHEGIITLMIQDMRSGNYAHLITAMQNWLPGAFEFLGDPRSRPVVQEDEIDESVPPELEDLLDPHVFVAEMNEMTAECCPDWRVAATATL